MRAWSQLRTVVLGTAMTVGIIGGGAPSAWAIPVTSDPSMLVLPLSGTPDVELSSEFSTMLQRNVDYTTTISLVLQDPGTDFDDLQDADDTPVLFNGTLTFTWNGTIHGAIPDGPLPSFVLFAITDERWRPLSFDESDPIGTSLPVLGGFVASSFGGADLIEGPLNVADAPAGGFIDDSLGNQWIGVKLPLTSEESVSFDFVWALGEDLTGFPDAIGEDENGDPAFFLRIRFFRDVFLVPEPGALAMVASGVLGLALLGRRRRA